MSGKLANRSVERALNLPSLAHAYNARGANRVPAWQNSRKALREGILVQTHGARHDVQARSSRTNSGSWIDAFKMAVALVTAFLLFRVFEGGLGAVLIDIYPSPDHASVHTSAGLSVDNVAHSIYGGLYSQLLFGESFEEHTTTLTAAGSLVNWWDLEGKYFS